MVHAGSDKRDVEAWEDKVYLAAEGASQAPPRRSKDALELEIYLREKLPEWVAVQVYSLPKGWRAYFWTEERDKAPKRLDIHVANDAVPDTVLGQILLLLGT